MDFKPFAAAVAVQFSLMSKHELFNVDIETETLLNGYQAAFPDGTNPIFRERKEHDCSCCNNFIKNIGKVVAIINGKVQTVWDIDFATIDPTYALVTQRMGDLIRAMPIKGLFRTNEPGFGAVSTRELLTDLTGKGGAGTRTWNHFHGEIAARHRTPDVDRVVGEFNTNMGVFERGLKELTAGALQEVAALISDKLLYRGDEHAASVGAFTKLHTAYNKLTSQADKTLYVLTNMNNPVTRFRNTAIGTLVTDLSSGVPTEAAVKAFETKVAPENYKRPTALVTKGMKDQAMKTIAELGLEPALSRRFATIADININNVKWADMTAQSQMKGGLSDLMDSIPTAKAGAVKDSLVLNINIEDFMATVLPQAKTIDMLVKNRHLSNFMAITAPVYESEPGDTPLFKWDNAFAWTYTGNISDSIKQRVKAAGGATDAVLRVSLAWHNGDDLDLHAYEPNGAHIYFGTRGTKTPGNRGMLDVDMNAGRAQNSKDPVENITWDTPADGEYIINVNNFCLRSKSDVGYTLEVENNGVTHQYTCEQSPSNGGTHKSLVLTVKGRQVTGIKAMSVLVGGSFSQESWGIATETPVRVSAVMLSPNYWDGNATGNKHTMFILDGCKTDEPLRGIMNEYLNSKLEVHRKVFEILGEKTKCQPTDEQLAGLGFSSTKGDSVQVTVNKTKHYNINF